MATTCEGCKKPIIWIKTVKGKSMPCDPELVTVISRIGMIYKGFVPHWVTCKDADKFRPRKRGHG